MKKSYVLFLTIAIPLTTALVLLYPETLHREVAFAQLPGEKPDTGITGKKPDGGISGEIPSETKLINPLGSEVNDISSLLEKIVNWLIVIASPIAVGMVMVGAFQMIFAGGDPEKFKTGKKTIIYVVIGYAIILIGWGITSIITSILSV